jgi:RND family efflux transporter MFP subunit
MRRPTIVTIAAGAAALALLLGALRIPGAASAQEHAGHDMGDSPAPAPPAGEKPAAAPKKGGYYCPMHPTYRSDRPSDCPICGMALVPEQETETEVPASSEGDAAGRVTVTATTVRVQLTGVRLEDAERRPFAKTIRAVGRVEYDERLLSAVSLKFGGWIEKLFVSATGDPVKKGEPLFEIYSPEFLEAHRNHIIAMESAERARKAGQPVDEMALEGARNRLRLWDLTDAQIRELETSMRPATTVQILSKVEGVVIKRSAVVGAYVQPGAEILDLADVSTVWVRADFYEYEVPEVKTGLDAEVTLAALPGETLRAKVVYVYPYVNDQTRTVSVRLELPNADRRLKPGMYANVTVAVDLGEQVVVDDDAVLDTGTREIVFVAEGEGRFVPRDVVLGPRSEGRVVVRSGLREGERVVSSGNFLVDSESRLKAALRATGAPVEPRGRKR